ncbi:hypothetical protein L1987_52613 [Smallanthus sonchifolius]|uniref:Uncharacterized protein n=1 Tax=Smallanthus sonchifolius TaxID=185202 RepID=A0ACB9ET21_9ASTR|nr:hypothetical protein L1987_52613 [Smallanthus sonchifolius]
MWRWWPAGRCWKVDLKLMKDFFIDAVENEAVIQRGGRVEGNKPNMPQKIFVAYVLLIILYGFMLIKEFQSGLGLEVEVVTLQPLFGRQTN